MVRCESIEAGNCAKVSVWKETTSRISNEKRKIQLGGLKALVFHVNDEEAPTIKFTCGVLPWDGVHLGVAYQFKKEQSTEHWLPGDHYELKVPHSRHPFKFFRVFPDLEAVPAGPYVQCDCYSVRLVTHGDNEQQRRRYH